MTMPALFSGQPLSGQQLGTAIFQFLPSMPHESPVPMPRALARVLFPQGFVPGIAPTMVQQPAPLIPPAGMPAQPPAPAVDAKGNAIARTQAMPANQAARPQPAPQPAPQGYRPTQSGGNPIRASSQRIRIAERHGM